MTFGSGFVLSSLTGRGLSMVTAGPPSVAIFVAAMSVCGESCAPVGSDAAGGSAWLAGNEAVSEVPISVLAILGSATVLSSILVSSILVSTTSVSMALVSATGA